MKILSRGKQVKLLEEIHNSEAPEFLAVYGRRRVGKTYLIKNFFEGKGIFFHITGTPKATAKQQLVNFSHMYTEAFKEGDSYDVPSTWQNAFNELRKSIKIERNQQKITLFFDELPWLASKKSGFLKALTYAWNQFLSSDPRIILIVCGSAASWMINNVINDKGGLYNRLTRLIKLQPFTLLETEQYLKGKGVQLSRTGISELYMALGGVAAYLDMVDTGKSPAQIIGDKIFNPNALLYGEFDRLFKSLFSKSELHIKLIEALSAKKEGMEKNVLFSKININSGSVQKRIKNELIESGFVGETVFFGNQKRRACLRLIDEYSIFYLKWRQEMKNSRVAPQPNHWLVLQNTPSWKSWSGYAFESLCYNHINQIATALGISGIIYSWSSWRYLPVNKDDTGVQIDMVIDRSDNCINLCELKYYSGKFTVTKAYAENLQIKKQKFIEMTGTRKTIFMTLITIHGAKENQHYLEAVNNQITLDDLFIV